MRRPPGPFADHDLDILVDLAGHTTGSRPEILAHKPAQVLITHLGYHGAIGLAAVDYKLTDRLADDPQNERFQIEKLLFMDALSSRADHIDAAPGAKFTRRFEPKADSYSAGIRERDELSPRLLDTWARIFRELPRGGRRVLAHRPARRIDPRARHATRGPHA